MKQILTIAGSDSSGGAGIQGDLKTIYAYGFHGLSAITAITAQNSVRITKVEEVDTLKDQLETLKEDISFDGIKIGMLHSKKQVEVIVTFLKKLQANLPVVYDPVMVSSTGKVLMEEEALKFLVSELIPLVTLVTPNLLEVNVIGKLFFDDFEIQDNANNLESLVGLQEKLKTSVLLKGGHIVKVSGRDESVDYLFMKDRQVSFVEKRLDNKHNHGTGCCLSSAITCELAMGKSLEKSIFCGKRFVTLAIKHAYAIGKGVGPVDPLIHFITNTVTINDVANSCLATGGRPIMAEAIEEMAEITSISQALVLNLGTLNKQRLESIEKAVFCTDIDKVNILLDPVGCGSSAYRLQAAKRLLDTHKIAILRLNAREGLALCNEKSDKKFGVDSDEFDVEDKILIAKKLLNLYDMDNLIIVISGEIDLVVNHSNIKVIKGGSSLQTKISGTGCMLNGIIMTEVAKGKDTLVSVIKGLEKMNTASEYAESKLSNPFDYATYKQELINELGQLNGDNMPKLGKHMKKEIYLVTDHSLDFENELLPKTEEALKNGVSILQYRSKDKDLESKIQEASKLRDLCRKYKVTFIINDDVKLAKIIGADGVHLGIEDMSIKEAKDFLGHGYIIGATAKSVKQALKAHEEGADYLGVGALNKSPTKPEAIPVSSDVLAKISSAINIPIYGIGGIRHYNLCEEDCNHLNGVAVVSAVYKGGLSELKLIQQVLK